jgi:SAM-dependent methyltransferase
MSLLDRNITIVINYFLDNICPLFLRDCKWFMYPIIKLAYGKETKAIMGFKEKFPFLENSEIELYYRNIANVPINASRMTDLNKQCLNWIVKNALPADVCGGGVILDAACGRGYLLQKILEANPAVKCIGVDIAPSIKGINIECKKADITALPFADNSFDTVLCTHVLEHIREPQKALAELIRVTRKRLIVVVPRQRECLYTVDLHVNFFPYLYSFKRFIGIKDAAYLNLGGDFLCCMDF